MKIGTLAQYLDTRSDIRDLLDMLSHDHEVTFYAPASQAEKIRRLCPFLNVVPLAPITGFANFFYVIWQYVYLLAGKIPASRYNYYMTEHIKSSSQHCSPTCKAIRSAVLFLSRITPKIMSYDQYLDGMLCFKTRAEISADIDVFLCFTEIYQDHFFAQIVQQGKPVWTYVYSWDHPCKMKSFSQRTHYLVWNKGLKDDLIDLHQIKAGKIHIWGATQFAWIEQMLNAQRDDHRDNPYQTPFIYLGCATGYETLTVQEVKYCILIGCQLEKTLPTWKLVIRPYPFQKNPALYQPLRELSNVIFDDSISRQDKFLRVRHAKAFLHFGTTMGYEAGYSNTPSFLIDLVDASKDPLLYGFVHQYQNDKYLNHVSGALVIKSMAGLVQMFINLSAGQKTIYSNTHLRSSTQLQSLPVLKEKLIDLIRFSNN
jgi:hypothetical protein